MTDENHELPDILGEDLGYLLGWVALGETLGVVGAAAKLHRLAEEQPSSAPSRRCPWCECWEPDHTGCTPKPKKNRPKRRR
jgi:hypothetical protein